MKDRSLKLLLSAGASVAAVLLGLGAAHAQEASGDGVQPPAASRAASKAALDEIVVMVRRREESLQDTPVAVTALGAAALEARNLKNISEVASVAPNLQYSVGPSGSSTGANFFIRGVGQLDFINTSDPGVGLYLDGVYIGRATGAALELTDIERVEVLRGPQGTLFGKNTIGGAVSVISASPDWEFGGTADLTLGSFNRVDSRVSVNVPLKENLAALRITAMSKQNDGFATREVDGAPMGDDNDVGARAHLRLEPSESFRWDLSADMTRRRAHLAAHSAIAIVPSAPATAFTTATGIPFDSSLVSSDPRENSTTGVRPTDDLDIWGVSSNAEWRMNFATLRSITAYRELEQATGSDFDGTAVAYNDQETDISQSQFSQELQLLGDSFADRLSWILGVYYLREESDLVNRNIDAIYLTTGVDNYDFNNLVTDSYAAFGQATYRFTPQWSVTAGARYSYENKQADFTTTRSNALTPISAAAEENWSNWTPRLGVEYKPYDDLLLYASYTEGFKSGGFDGRPRNAEQFEPYDPETVSSYEIGFKSDLFDRRLRVNAAAFYSEYDDLQLVSIAFDSSSALYFPVTNAGNVELSGGEIEVEASPIPGLVLFGSAGYVHHEFTYVSPTATVTLDTKLPGAPEWSGAAGFNYDYAIPGAGLVSLGADVVYKSSYYHLPLNSQLDKEDGYTLLNAQLRYTPPDERWTIALFGKNLTDETYYTWGQALDVIGDSPATAWFGRPRELGVRLSVDF